MLILPGAPALSSFRLRKLERRLAERAALERLPSHGPALPEEPRAGQLLLTVSRPGTVSSWSSKATEHICRGTSPN